MKNKFQKSIEKNQLLIDSLKNHSGQSLDKEVIRCLEGEFVIYHGTYSKLKPIRFILHFFKSFFYINEYTLEQTEENDSDRKIASVVTAEHLYIDNLKPLINELKERGIGNTKLILKKKKKLSIRRLHFFSKESFSIISFFMEKKDCISINNFVLLCYLKYILLQDSKSLLEYLEANLNRKYLLYLSADVCDIFSRAIATLCRNKNDSFYLLQCGPLDNSNNLEINSIICSEFLAWSSSRDFLIGGVIRDERILVKYFEPPRFLAPMDVITDKKYDIVFFLTWLNYSSPSELVNNHLKATLEYLEQRGDQKIFLKMHPHTDPYQEKELVDLYNNYDFIDKTALARDVIGNSKLILNFGSTVCFDADQMSVKAGIINFDKNIPDDHDFFKLKHVTNIKNINEIDALIDKPLMGVIPHKKDHSLPDYIEETINS